MPRALRGARGARGVVRCGVAALRLAFGRARLFQNAGAVRAARVALVSELVRRAAARGRASVKHGSGSAGLHELLAPLWFRSLWRAAVRALGAVASQAVSGITGGLRRSPAVRERAQRSNRRPAALSMLKMAKAPNEPRGIRASLRERVQESSGTVLGGLTAGCCAPAVSRPADARLLETRTAR